MPENLRCKECGSESIIHVHKSIHDNTGICRECWNKEDIFYFQTAYQDEYNREDEKEYDPCFEDGQYY